MTEKKIILVKMRLTDNGRYHASLENNPSVWAAGNNIKECIGDLVLAHSEEFNIEIKECK